MTVQQGAILVWFGRGREQDAQFLQKWRTAPLTYSPDAEQALDENWCVDRYETILGVDQTGALFQRAAQLTLNNMFYPPAVMTSVSDFNLVGRTVQTGDRIVQRIGVFQYRGLPILEVLTMNEITQVVNEPRQAGFTYTTTTAHSEIGEWSPTVAWRENGEVALVINVISRARPGASRWSRRLTRRMQLHAHKLSIQSFINQINGAPVVQSSGPRVTTAASLLPIVLLSAALGIFFSVLLGFGKKER